MIGWFFFGCGPPTPITPPLPTPVVLSGPALLHEPTTSVLSVGESLSIEAVATDPDGVDAVELLVRTEGELAFERIPMVPVKERWVANLPPVESPAVEYWIRAYDRSDWRVPASLPGEGADRPIRIAVRPVSLPLPVRATFEGASSNTTGLYELGWRDAALRFRGRRWSLGQGASTVALHRSGFEGIQAIDDWLVSPTLDLSTVEHPSVRWSEWGEHVERADHTLWISTTSSDPSDGSFVEVAKLQPPREGEWWQAPIIDLTPFRGATSATLAWQLHGENTDGWAIDDVMFGEIGSDLRITEVEPMELTPGFVGSVRVVVENMGSSSSGGTLSGRITSGLAGFNQDVSTGPLGAGESVALALPVTVALQQLDDSLVTGELTVTGSDSTFVEPVQLVVGDPTLAVVEVETSSRGAFELQVGTGPVGSPLVELPVYSGTLEAGVHTFAVDVTRHAPFLPATASNRWWMRLQSASVPVLNAFGFETNGVEVTSSASGRLASNRPVVRYLPHRPRMVGLSATPSAPPLVPGVPTAVQVMVRNDGGSTEGPVEVSVMGDDVEFAPVSVQPMWEADEVRVLDVMATVDASHTDGNAIDLDVVFADAVESYGATTTLAVPWPRVALGGAFFVGDGVLDPTEDTSLLAPLRNDGSLATQPLGCEISSPDLGVNFPAPSLSLPSLQPGQVVVLSTPISTAGVTANSVSMELLCSSGLGTFDASTQLEIGGTPWQILPIDPVGDALPGASFDIREARFRIDDGRFQLEFLTAGPPDEDPSLEVWMVNDNSGWTNHLWVVDEGESTLFGVLSQGFTPLATPSLTVGVDRLRLSVPLAEMDFGDPMVAVAAGTGFCGAAGFHCEQWPDAWGNPFVFPQDSENWVQLSW